jgi:hypothetical protein
MWMCVVEMHAHVVLESAGQPVKLCGVVLGGCSVQVNKPLSG